MKTKIEIKSIWGSVLFSFEKENNTVKYTVVEAVRQGANLREADLRGADLRETNLQGANLRGANLRETNLRGADLWGADLRGADLRGANLRGADLRGANLRGADLRGANLREADLRGANLREADLRVANLWGANLRGADLWGADLWGADLRKADLREADLREADLRGIIGKELSDLKKFFWIVPEEGAFIAWKKCRNAILKIEIPTEAKRTSNIKNRKCRAEFVNVLSIENMEGIALKSAYSLKSNEFIYQIGIVKADSFDDDWTNDCSNGIHFFMTKQEAIEWDM